MWNLNWEFINIESGQQGALVNIPPVKKTFNNMIIQLQSDKVTYEINNCWLKMFLIHTPINSKPTQ